MKTKISILLMTASSYEAMIQLPWGQRTLGCCCEEDNICRDYYPCCIRDIRFEVDFFITQNEDAPQIFDGLTTRTNRASVVGVGRPWMRSKQPDSAKPLSWRMSTGLTYAGNILGAPPVGDGSLSTAVVKKMTVENKCNSQTSVDWSTWNNLDNDVAGGQVRATFPGGFIGQNCTFGIDIALEDIFCLCTGGVNFVIRVDVCNDTDIPVDVDMRQPSFAVAFSGKPRQRFCVFKLLSADTESVIGLAPGAVHQFVFDFGKVDDCLTKCITPSEVTCEVSGPCDAVRAPFIFDTLRPGDRHCLRPVDCSKGDRPESLPSPLWNGVSSCIDPLCPECGCVLDSVGPPGGCSCKCQGVESSGACASPKTFISGATEKSGSGSLCVNVAHAMAVQSSGFAIMECRNSDCKLVSEMTAPGNRIGASPDVNWKYQRLDETPGGLPSDNSQATINTDTFTDARIVDCASTTISWNAPDSAATEITVNGVNESGTTPGPTIRTGGT